MYGTTSSEKDLKTSSVTPTHWTNVEKPTLKQLRKAERLIHNLMINAVLGAVSHNWKGTENLKLL